MHRMVGIGGIAALLLAAAPGCGKGKADDVNVGPQYETHPLATGARIEKVSWFQGVEKVLYQAPGVFSSGVVEPPAVVGRDAMLRVAVAPADSWQPRQVAVVVTVGTGGTDIVLDQVGEPREWNFTTLEDTFNFQIPAEFVTADLTLDVAVHEISPTPAGTGAPVPEDLSWSSATDGGLDLEQSDSIDLVIIPLKYDADGSGRVPDLGQQAIAEITGAMTAMYPATQVNVIVEDPMPWSTRIEPFGNGWTQLLTQISERRTTDDVRENTYYYAMFDPDDSAASYCAAGCILGLSLLPESPQDTWGRASVGVGFRTEQVSTLIHEVGHAHGREHAPCNLYGQPSDPGYPYPNAQLGSVGYDIVEDRLVPPTAASDLMSYCQPFFVSDYTFNAFHERISALRGFRHSADRVPLQSLVIDGDGEATFGPTMRATRTSGEPVEIELLDADGAVIDIVEGGLLPFDHLPGGMALIEPPGRAVAGARLAD